MINKYINTKEETKIKANQEENPFNNKIIVSSLQSLDIINISDIIRVEADGDYSILHLIDNKKITDSKNLLYYEKKLASRNFYRIHDKHLINLKHLRKFIKEQGGYAIMSDGPHVPVSQRKKLNFVRLLYNKIK